MDAASRAELEQRLKLCTVCPVGDHVEYLGLLEHLEIFNIPGFVPEA